MSIRIKVLLSFLIVSLVAVYSQSELKIIDKIIEFGQRIDENRKIDVIIVHSVYNNSGGDKYDIDLVIKQFSNYYVSSHYVIGRDGTIYQLVKEKDIAYHAGKSCLPDGRICVNSCSIGIELITSIDEAPTEEQITSLTALVKDIKYRYKINYILRHSDIAPDRKTDPWNLNWEDFLKRIEG